MARSNSSYILNHTNTKSLALRHNVLRTSPYFILIPWRRKARTAEFRLNPSQELQDCLLYDKLKHERSFAASSLAWQRVHLTCTSIHDATSRFCFSSANSIVAVLGESIQLHSAILQPRLEKDSIVSSRRILL